MAACRRLLCIVTFQRLVAAVALIAVLIPQTVCAEPLLVFFKDDTGSAISWQQTPQNRQKTAATVSLNQSGDLVVKYGSVQMVFAYCPPEDPHTQQDVPRVNMASSQEVPPINGLSVKLHFVF
ncbi:hypothetical protein FY034_09185 [Trichlorobacter lovleyi]|uniref:hypothetical protein n=1 Tax=Trichlorobacter lovleyi TaxID=313985 RepID=UPI00224095FE|nr:hypothetical protein [Trichlorobacter lovleyi]QOX79093.1 hypothetical protein FY034_09185 [Trichlorobacter lovleyi]